MKKIFEKLKSVDNGTIIRTIALILSIINQIVAVIGCTSFASATWYQILSVVVLALTSIWTAWENNDWTFFAKLGTDVLNALEDGKLTVDEVKALIEKAEKKDENNSSESSTDDQNS